jgi:rubrerythrin
MDLEKYKAVITDAVKNEIDAKEFYEKVSVKIRDPFLKKLFDKFAKEEEKHEQILTDILNQQIIQSSYFDFTKDFKVAETIGMPVVNEYMDLKNAIGLAMKNEEIAMKQYIGLADNCEDTELKAVFLDLASMERKHKFKLEENFVDVAYPEVW